jgi:hypothetical protein
MDVRCLSHFRRRIADVRCLSHFQRRCRSRLPSPGLPLDLSDLIPAATRILRGEQPVPGVEADQVRDRLLAGYRYVLVDEYQDIDQQQYELISALTDRTGQDDDTRLSILAVGDDDQNIYTFRGANVEFIRRFQTDYQAHLHCLLENYRSTAHIINAANRLIAHNRDRMKTDREIRINAARQNDPPGGLWERLDPVARGRVQVLRPTGGQHEAELIVGELLRLSRLSPRMGTRRIPPPRFRSTFVAKPPTRCPTAWQVPFPAAGRAVSIGPLAPCWHALERRCRPSAPHANTFRSRSCGAWTPSVRRGCTACARSPVCWTGCKSGGTKSVALRSSRGPSKSAIRGTSC